MKRIVFTGGPSSGKTTIMEELKRFYNKAIFVPESATLLLNGGYPKPQPYSEEWHLLFEDSIFHLQKSIEDAASLKATHAHADLVILDRGLLDVAAHLPNGMNQYCQRYEMTEEESLARYDVVIHLVSFAMFDPIKYQKIAEERWGKSHFTSFDYAINIEQSSYDAWANHKNRFIVDGKGDIKKKTEEVIDIIKRVMV